MNFTEMVRHLREGVHMCRTSWSEDEYIVYRTKEYGCSIDIYERVYTSHTGKECVMEYTPSIMDAIADDWKVHNPKYIREELIQQTRTAAYKEALEEVQKQYEGYLEAAIEEKDNLVRQVGHLELELCEVQEALKGQIETNKRLQDRLWLTDTL